MKNCLDCGKEYQIKGRRCGSCRYKRSGRSRCPDCGAPIHKVDTTVTTLGQAARINQIKEAEQEFGIFGVFPDCIETSIYVLKRSGVTFYVGATKRLIPRMTAHKQKFGYDITLHVLRNVLDEVSIIEECREIVTQYDAGETIENCRTPEPSKLRGF